VGHRLSPSAIVVETMIDGEGGFVKSIRLSSVEGFSAPGLKNEQKMSSFALENEHRFK
jgi:hypothetical protein